VKPEGERDAATIDFVRALPRKAQKALERLQGGLQATGGSVAGWYASLSLAADRAGLLACDDVGAAARVLARLSGESQDQMVAAGGHGPDALSLGAVQTSVSGVAELVRFFLSDAYHELRGQLGEASGRL
jgi:hypothetical protein